MADDPAALKIGTLRRQAREKCGTSPCRYNSRFPSHCSAIGRPMRDLNCPKPQTGALSPLCSVLYVYAHSAHPEQEHVSCDMFPLRVSQEVFSSSV